MHRFGHDEAVERPGALEQEGVCLGPEGVAWGLETLNAGWKEFVAEAFSAIPRSIVRVLQ